MRTLSDRGGAGLGPQDLLHRAPLSQLIDQLVHVTDVAHERILNLMDTHATDGAGDELTVRVERRCLSEELLKRAPVLLSLHQADSVVASQPGQDLGELGLPASLALDLGEIERVDVRKRNREDAMGLSRSISVSLRPRATAGTQRGETG